MMEKYTALEYEILYFGSGYVPEEEDIIRRSGGIVLPIGP